MNIRDWGLGEIMQLPDECFGRRFPVCAGLLTSSAGGAWDISELALPEVCVLWNVVLWCQNDSEAILTVRLALGNQQPTSLVMMTALEALIPGLGVQGLDPRYIMVAPGFSMVSLPVRCPINTRGRRLVLEVISDGTALVYAQVVVEVSSIPTEVPDWLISEYRRSR